MITQTPLRYLLEVLRSTDVCERGAWPLGLQLLRLARAVLYAHPTAVVFGVLKDLLTVLTQTYGNLGTGGWARKRAGRVGG